MLAKDKSIGRANQKRSPRTSQSDRPIRSVRQGQVNPTGQSEAFAKDKLFGSANHIHRSDYLRTDFLRRIYKIGRTLRFSQTDHLDGYLTVIIRSHSSENLQDRTDSSAQPIRSLGRLFNRYKRSQSSEAPSRSDGQTLKPKSLTRKSRTITSAISRLRAKAVPRTHKPLRAHKSITRKDVFNHTQ